MKKKGGKKPPRSQMQALYEIRDSIQELEPKKGLRKFLDHFLIGILRGLGFALGSTVILALLILILQAVLRSGAISTFVNDTFEAQITELIDEQSTEDRN